MGSGGLLGILCLGFLLFALELAALWVVFEKAGRPGWGALIPIYNVVLLFRVGGQSGWWVLLLLIPPINAIVGIWIWLKVAEHFGRSWPFGLGLAFLQFIFLPILAFGDSEYRGSVHFHEKSKVRA